MAKGSRSFEALLSRTTTPQTPAGAGRGSLLLLPGYLAGRGELSQGSWLPDTWSVEQERRGHVSQSGRGPDMALFFPI